MQVYACVLTSSAVAYVLMKEKKMKMSNNNLILLVMQVKYTLAHLHSEMKYEVWRVSPDYK